MAMSIDEMLAERPVDRERVEAHKERLLASVRAHRLRELREQAGLTQAELAERIGVGQRQVSKIENGDLENTKVSSIRNYLEALGGTPHHRIRRRRQPRPGGLKAGRLSACRG